MASYLVLRHIHFVLNTNVHKYENFEGKSMFKLRVFIQPKTYKIHNFNLQFRKNMFLLDNKKLEFEISTYTNFNRVNVVLR